MHKIIPISDLQRQASQIVNELTASHEAVLVTQHGRPAAVLLSAAHYSQIEGDLARLDELELLELVAQARQAKQAGQTLSHQQVKARLAKKQAAASRKARGKHDRD